MNVRLHELTVHCKRERVPVTFVDFNYFHGRMGAGKSTVVRLIDFCLGGDLVDTPALQAEFVAATLDVTIGVSRVLLTRNRSENTVRAQWGAENEPFDVIVPIKVAGAEVLPGTKIEVLSDLIFFLAGIQPPMVRRSKVREESQLVRLSIRDLLWYCYLDQDSMDNSLFRLDDSNHNIRLKSLDVLRLIIGFHQQQISELQIRLEEMRAERQRLETAAEAIRAAMTEEQLASPVEIQAAINTAHLEQKAIDVELEEVRRGIRELRTHATESLRNVCRSLAAELVDIDTSLFEIDQSLQKDKNHRNTLLNLAVRQRRAQSSRDALSGIEFSQCPQCNQILPQRSGDVCPVCGQVHQQLVESPIDDDTLQADVRSRTDELEIRMGLQRKAGDRLKRQRAEIAAEKEARDAELNKASKEYDSAYLSQTLEQEKRKARLAQRVVDLKQMLVLANRVVDMENTAKALIGEEAKIRAEIREARLHAERDTTNLERLKVLFLQCLLKAKMPGFFPDDFVQMQAPWYMPEVVGKNTGDFAITSFETLGSGGKKTLFKCCFALAIHLLAREQNATLPTLLIIDSPMKNISERENREQFVGFNRLLYDLSQNELRETQFVVVDKEYDAPPQGLSVTFFERYMTPDDPKNGPLIPGYRGK